MRASRVRLRDDVKAKKRPDPNIITETRCYKLITPLLGGGFEAKQVDPITPVHVSGIKGQLRFWWRATRGGQFGGDLARMRAAEGELWGSARDKTGRPSRISLSVLCQASGNELELYGWWEWEERRGRLGWYWENPLPSLPEYIAFPLRVEKDWSTKPQGRGYLGQQTGERLYFRLLGDVTFKLKFSYNTCPFSVDGIEITPQKEISTAFWAWETFGGIGARTRRGFGAVSRQEDANLPSATGLAAWLSNEAENITEGPWPHGVPYLSCNSVRKSPISPAESDPMTAWHKLVGLLKEFRQMRPERRRSRWPEPDAIRHLTGQYLRGTFKGKGYRDHHKLILGRRIDKFPRAALGLPIIFHFPKSRPVQDTEHSDDPDDTTLYGRGKQRLASPIILRPLQCAAGRARGLILRLEIAGTLVPLKNLVLENEKEDFSTQVSWELDEKEAKAIDKAAVGAGLTKRLQGQSDIVKAFLAYAATRYNAQKGGE